MYICEINQLNKGFTIVEMNEILAQVVLTDLSNYHKYLDGILKKVDKRCDEPERLKYDDNKEKLLKFITEKINIV